MPRHAEILALHEDERDALLERLGIAEAYKAGELSCCVCQQPLRERGLGAIRMVEGGAVVSCGHLDCMETFGG